MINGNLKPAADYLLVLAAAANVVSDFFRYSFILFSKNFKIIAYLNQRLCPRQRVSVGCHAICWPVISCKVGWSDTYSK